MPSDKKRINLTVPDSVYEQLQEYKEANGITNDAGACLQLVVQQLQAQQRMRVLMKAYMTMSEEEVAALSAEGSTAIRRALEQKAREQR